MAFDPLMAVHRFGAGPAWEHAFPTRADDMLAEAAAGDPFAASHPVISVSELVALDDRYRGLRRTATRSTDQDEAEAARQEGRTLLRATRDQSTEAFRDLFLRRLGQPYGLGERLVTFWTDHFTAMGGGGILQYGTPAFSNESIRPHIMGRFADMLKAVVRAPLMLTYLDQSKSVGPNSRLGKRRANRGLNENLARELLELHTLGVGGPYGQRDVVELAELLTGLVHVRGEGFVFRRNVVEPGAERVLGREYSGDDLAAIDAFLEDVAVHPVTARHLAEKLAIHFVADRPDDGLVRHISTRYAASDGSLAEAVAALLEHPAAWSAPRGNVKWPVDFIASGLRAVGVPTRRVARLSVRQVRGLLENPIGRMGQRWDRATDPAGWDEEDESWVTPQAVVERVNWAMRAPARLVPELPDPRELLTLVAGDAPPGELAFAVSAAETRREGVGLVLASPSFQRR
ncbi:MAG: DUF1800 domain-containing protein [Pseudomonadota bacterium]